MGLSETGEAPRILLARTAVPTKEAALSDVSLDRRGLLAAAAPLLAALPALLAAERGRAAPDPRETIVVPPTAIDFKPHIDGPANSVESAELFSRSSQHGLYLNLTRWHPGWMSAPHWYETDRLCVVVSGTWWVTSGETFDPASTIPVVAGSFVHRVARTPHYDGVRADGTEPAVIAICGTGPITFHPVDPSRPNVRRV